jgi:hypothetical protein
VEPPAMVWIGALLPIAFAAKPSIVFDDIVVRQYQLAFQMSPSANLTDVIVHVVASLLDNPNT